MGKDYSKTRIAEVVGAADSQDVGLNAIHTIVTEEYGTQHYKQYK